jgi:hypothetical protein
MLALCHALSLGCFQSRSQRLHARFRRGGQGVTDLRETLLGRLGLFFQTDATLIQFFIHEFFSTITLSWL